MNSLARFKRNCDEIDDTGQVRHSKSNLLLVVSYPLEISLAILCVFLHFSAVYAIVCCDSGLLNLLDGLSGSFSVFLSNADTLWLNGLKRSIYLLTIPIIFIREHIIFSIGFWIGIITGIGDIIIKPTKSGSS